MTTYRLVPQFDWQQLIGQTVRIEASDQSIIAVQRDRTAVLVAQAYTPRRPRQRPGLLTSEPLSHGDLQRVLRSLQRNQFSARNCLLVHIGIHERARISDLLRLRLHDAHGYRFIDAIPPLIEAWTRELSRLGRLNDETPLFCSRKRDSHGARPAISRNHAAYIIHRAVRGAGIARQISPESLRKTFCHRLYDERGRRLGEVQRLMGHKSIGTTASYLAFRPEFRESQSDAS